MANYAWSDGGEWNGPFSTVNEAIQDAEEMLEGDEEMPNIEVGEVRHPKISDFISADGIVDIIAETAFDNYGECAGYFLEDVKGEQIMQLELLLEVVLEGWAKKHGLQPCFFAVNGKIRKFKFASDCYTEEN